VQLLPLDEAARPNAPSGSASSSATVAPGVVQYTTDVLFPDLWRRPDLAPRDRSLVTVSGLIRDRTGRATALSLEPGVDYGLTQTAGRRGVDAIWRSTPAGPVYFLEPLPLRGRLFERRPRKRHRLEKSLGQPVRTPDASTPRRPAVASVRSPSPGSSGIGSCARCPVAIRPLTVTRLRPRRQVGTPPEIPDSTSVVYWTTPGATCRTARDPLGAFGLRGSSSGSSCTDAAELIPRPVPRVQRQSFATPTAANALGQPAVKTPDA